MNAQVMTCDTCGDVATMHAGDDYRAVCRPCYVDALMHGHLHGLHDDDDTLAPVPDCPMCRAALAVTR